MGREVLCASLESFVPTRSVDSPIPHLSSRSASAVVRYVRASSIVHLKSSLVHYERAVYLSLFFNLSDHGRGLIRSRSPVRFTCMWPEFSVRRELRLLLQCGFSIMLPPLPLPDCIPQAPFRFPHRQPFFTREDPSFRPLPYPPFAIFDPPSGRLSPALKR